MNDIELIRKTEMSEKKGISAQDLNIIRRMTALQMTRKQIASAIGMSEQTFYRIQSEYPSIKIIIDQERTKAVSPVAERAMERAMEDDNMTRFVLERKGGWEKAPQSPINITNNNQASIESTENNLLDNLSAAELAHYQSLKPEDLLRIISMPDPSHQIIEAAPEQSSPEPMGHFKEPQLTPTPQPQQTCEQNSRPEPQPEEPIKKEKSESETMKEVVYNRLIQDNFKTPGVKPGPYSNQPYITSDVLDAFMREHEITSNSDKKVFMHVLSERGVKKRRTTKDDLRMTVYVGCKFK